MAAETGTRQGCFLLIYYQGSLSEWYPRVAVLGNRVAVVFHDSRSGYYGVYFKQSTDNGQNWSNDLLVSNATMESYRADVCLASDTIHLVWNCGYRPSTNGGVSWGNNYRLCYNGNNDMDEMPAVGFFADTVHVVWDKMASGTKSIYYIRKGTTQIGLPAESQLLPGFSLRLSPNQVRKWARVRLDLPVSGAIQVCLFDVSGRVRECPFKITNKDHDTELWFDCTKMPAGVYLLEIKAGGNQARQKITVRR